MKGFKDIDLKLCNGCGTCRGVCPNNAISIVDELPRLSGECNYCGLCYSVCPGMEFSYPDMNKILFKDSMVDPEIGSYKSIFLGNSSNSHIRESASSGGVVTAILSNLLEAGKINGAVVVAMDELKPWVPRLMIASSKEEILKSAQSKYAVIPVNEILKNLSHRDGVFAYVGLPCHIHGIRKAQGIGQKGAGKIKYCIGIFCGFNMSYRATDFLIKKSKIRKEDIESLEYRGGPWPGGFRIRAKDSREYFLGKHAYNYLNLLFTPKRCLVCPDLTGEFADVSLGDAWGSTLDNSGYSTIIIRTEKGKEIIQEAVKAKKIEVKDGSIEGLKASHGHLIAYKKHGLFLRMKLLGLQPRYRMNRNFRMKTKAKIFNCLFMFLVIAGRTKIIFFILKNIPVNLFGFFAAKFRQKAQKSFGLQKKNNEANIFGRIALEFKYLTRKEWSFPDVGYFWDSVTEYDEVNKGTHSYYRRFIDGFRLSNIPEKSYILDVCSRTGNGTKFFWDRGRVRKAVCADVSGNFHNICARFLANNSVPFELKRLDSYSFPFNNEEFDAVICFETIEHFPRPGDFIKELARVVKKNGQVVLTTPNILWEPAHSLAAILNLHHSEGPHRFIRRRALHKYIINAGFDILAEDTTVLIPAGPRILIRMGEWLEKRMGRFLRSRLCLRRILICRKGD